MTNEEELKAKIKALVVARYGSTALDAQRKLFDDFDTDGDGRLSRSELKALLAAAGIGNALTRGAWVSGILEKLDTNGDDALSWSEYVAVLPPTMTTPATKPGQLGYSLDDADAKLSNALAMPDEKNAALFAHARKTLVEGGVEVRGEEQTYAGAGYMESRYGIVGVWIRQPGGRPSYNWGALAGDGPDGFVVIVDKDRHGNPRENHFRAFASALQGLDAYRATVALARAAAAAGDLLTFARILYAKGYYTGTSGTDEQRIRAYAAAVFGGALAYAKANGQPLAVKAPPAMPSTSTKRRGRGAQGVIIVGAAAVLAASALTKR